MVTEQHLHSNKWIFVSHSSNDLVQVRKVRNYLEEKGASPLLFHLRALDKPEEFWPLIVQEIHARNFFLYCESPGAQESPWVERERSEVAQSSEHRSIRIGTFDVSGETLDKTALDDFLASLRIFASFTSIDQQAVAPYLETLSNAGFDVYDSSTMQSGDDWVDITTNEIAMAARDGWVLIFVTENAIRSEFVLWELELARSLGSRIVPVVIEPVYSQLPKWLLEIQYLDCVGDRHTEGTDRLVKGMLTRQFG